MCKVQGLCTGSLQASETKPSTKEELLFAWITWTFSSKENEVWGKFQQTDLDKVCSKRWGTHLSGSTLNLKLSPHNFSLGTLIWSARCDATAWSTLWTSETRRSTKEKEKKCKLQTLWKKCLRTSSSCGGWHPQWSLLLQGDLQDGGGVRRKDHIPPHKYIKNTSMCGTTPTEHLLNAGRRPQTSQKARKSPCTWPCGWQGLGALAWCQAWASEVGEPSSGHWTTRDLLVPHNINWRELSQRSPSQR